MVVPVVNPDAHLENGARIARGERAWQRTNANGVDLNRNFPGQADIQTWHPFSGSPRPGGWHYTGPHALSEPESRALRDLVAHERPAYSLAFHSCGNMLLYPWGFTKANNPRQSAYERPGRAFHGPWPPPTPARRARPRGPPVDPKSSRSHSAVRKWRKRLRIGPWRTMRSS